MTRALRPLTADDAAMLLRWRNSPEVSRFMYTDHLITPDEHAAWLDGALGRADARYWVMTCDAVDVGFATLTDIDRRQGTASWALYIGEPNVRGSGMGAFTTYTVLEYAFGQLRLRKLSCEVLGTNTTAFAMYESFGFVREGRFREQILKPDGPVDVYRLGILTREWDGIRDHHRARLMERGIITG